MTDPNDTQASPKTGAKASTLTDLPDQLLDGGELDMRIAADGTWFYQGTPIRRQALVKLFSTVLRREDDGSYWLVTPVERGRVVVEDAPFLAVELAQEGSGRDRRLRLRTNVDDWVDLDGEHPLRVEERGDSEEPRPYILVRPGLEARLVRSVYYHLADLAESESVGKEERLGVWSNGHFFPLTASSPGPAARS